MDGPPQMREAEGLTAGGQSSLLLGFETVWQLSAADPEVKTGSAMYLFTFSAPKRI